MAVRPRRISDIKSLLTNVAQTSHYLVKFGGLPSPLVRFIGKKGVGRRFAIEDAGLLCFSASLPTPRLATADIMGNYTGVMEHVAHSVQYNQISLEFYVDSRYRSLKFFEGWIEFISSGSYNPARIVNENSPVSQNQLNYFVRMQYPEEYKSNRTTITKFDRDYNTEIDYTFIGLFPFEISETPVSYGSSDVMKIQVSFYYDRFVSEKVDRINNVITGSRFDNLINPWSLEDLFATTNKSTLLDDIINEPYDPLKGSKY